MNGLKIHTREFSLHKELTEINFQRISLQHSKMVKTSNKKRKILMKMKTMKKMNTMIRMPNKRILK
jgi:hypothetical protein